MNLVERVDVLRITGASAIVCNMQCRRYRPSRTGYLGMKGRPTCSYVLEKQNGRDIELS